MEHEKCYVFKPEEDRPAKRRRSERHGLQDSWRLRHKAYQEAWGAEQTVILSTLEKINQTTVAEIIAFLTDNASRAKIGRIPTALVLAGPGTSSFSSVQSAMSQRTAESNAILVSIHSNTGNNLKGFLRALIQRATDTTWEDEEGVAESAMTGSKPSRLLNYDLEILHEYVRERDVERVIVAFEDTEAFDLDLLSDLIELFGVWHDRIPFACILRIATSLEFLHQSLSKAATKHLDGRSFDAAPAVDEVEQVFKTLTNRDRRLWIGPSLAELILEHQSDSMQSIDRLVSAMRYAYMSAYYANALTVFLVRGLSFEDVGDDHFEALRCLESFRLFARKLLHNREILRLRDLLDSDEILFGFVRERLSTAQLAMQDMMAVIDAIRQLQERLPNAMVSKSSTLYILATSGQLDGAAPLRSLMLSIRKSSSETAALLLETVIQSALPRYIRQDCRNLLQELQQLEKEATQPLRSDEDMKRSSLRTTVVAQKVELSMQKATLSKQDASYSALLRRFTDALERHFKDKLISPNDMLFYEIFLYDLRSPHREVFMPRPRHAIERAMASPHDYLDCDCCEGEAHEATLAGTQPATAILYQLYLEAGSIINVFDLWQAFSSIIGENQPEERTIALFQRGLAELKYLGLVKQTRKRMDHIAKVAWKGL